MMNNAQRCAFLWDMCDTATTYLYLSSTLVTVQSCSLGRGLGFGL